MTEKRLSFNIKEKMLKLRGRGGEQEYLPVKWRLVMLRDLFPDAKVTTEVISYDPDPKTGHAAVRCTVELPTGAVGTGMKREDAAHFQDFLEKAECVPLDTQILTPAGFVAYDQVRRGDLVAAYDLVTDRLVWTPLAGVRVYRNKPLIAHASQTFRVQTTAHHTWALQSTKGKRRLAPLEAARPSEGIILAAPGPEPLGAPLPISPKDAYGIGYLAVAVDPRWRPRPFRPRIRPIDAAFVRPDGIPRVAHGGLHDLTAAFAALIQPLGITTQAQLLSLPARLSLEARRALLDGMIAASGETVPSGVSRILAFSPAIADLWHVTAALAGVPLGRPVVQDGFIKQTIRHRRRVDTRSLVHEPVGRADVWCPQVPPYGTWVARFADGTVTITGNTGAIGRAIAAAGIGAQYAREYEYEDDATSVKSYPGVDTGFELAAPSPTVDRSPRAADSDTRTLGQLKTELTKHVMRLGKERLQAKTQELFGVDTTARLTRDQFAELVRWAEAQPDPESTSD